MSTTFRSCPDGHRCENGSSCAEHPTDEGEYYCDCGTSGGDFAGLYCEYEADTYCQLQQETASNWFCTNQGTCVLSTGGAEVDDVAQWDCDCPADFDGPHCQFIAGNVPRDWPGYDFDPVTGTLAAPSAQHSSRNSNNDGLHVGAIIGIVIGLVVLIVLSFVGVLVVRKIRNRDGRHGVGQNATRDPSEGLKLEADGSVLQEVMESFTRTPNSTINGGSSNGNNGNNNGEAFDAACLANRSSDDHSVEVGVYSDNPRSSASKNNGSVNGNML